MFVSVTGLGGCSHAWLPRKVPSAGWSRGVWPTVLSLAAGPPLLWGQQEVLLHCILRWGLRLEIVSCRPPSTPRALCCGHPRLPTHCLQLCRPPSVPWRWSVCGGGPCDRTKGPRRAFTGHVLGLWPQPAPD